MPIFALFMCGLTMASPTVNAPCPQQPFGAAIGTFNSLASCKALKAQIESQLQTPGLPWVNGGRPGITEGQRPVTICMERTVPTWQPAR
jgi:hypothetical protein